MQDPKILLGALTAISMIAAKWWSVVIKESNIHHVEVVRNMLRLGVKLFIVSEIMLFMSFFWAWFHSSLSPTIWIGNVWPPRYVVLESKIVEERLVVEKFLSEGIEKLGSRFMVTRAVFAMPNHSQ